MNTIFLYSMPISNGKEQLWPLALAIIGNRAERGEKEKVKQRERGEKERES